MCPRICAVSTPIWANVFNTKISDNTVTLAVRPIVKGTASTAYRSTVRTEKSMAERVIEKRGSVLLSQCHTPHI